MIAASVAVVYVIVLVVAILFGWGSATVAGNKGYSFVLFFVLGFILGLIGLIIALVLPRKAGAPPPA